VTRQPTDEQARLVARQGQGYLNFDLVRIVDGEMNDVARDAETLGEVCMRGNNVMKGYYEQPEATTEAFDGGWFHSGDIGVWPPDGYIELRDLKKDIIISGGENISTIEVEQTAAQKVGASATEAEIIEFCRSHIAHFKCPAAIEFGDLPKTSTGKVHKFVLRDKEWADRAKRIN
jgi:fatty-acyl-CoA synthase